MTTTTQPIVGLPELAEQISDHLYRLQEERTAEKKRFEEFHLHVDCFLWKLRSEDFRCLPPEEQDKMLAGMIGYVEDFKPVQ